jgi:hypothetical protein
MFNSIEATTNTEVKLNTRQGEAEPDITDFNHPFVTSVVSAIEQLKIGELTPMMYQQVIENIIASHNLGVTLRPWIDRALAEKKDQVLYRRTGKSHREGIQLFYLEKNILHPPHCHHNILSTQLMLVGRVYAREYDRIARLTPKSLLLRLRTDRWMLPGDALVASELDKNCHWFGAGDEPAVMLNLNAYGYQDWTFNPKDRPLLRNLVDPTVGKNADGLYIAEEVSAEEAYAKFGGRPLEDFPT